MANLTVLTVLFLFSDEFLTVQSFILLYDWGVSTKVSDVLQSLMISISGNESAFCIFVAWSFYYNKHLWLAMPEHDDVYFQDDDESSSCSSNQE